MHPAFYFGALKWPCSTLGYIMPLPEARVFCTLGKLAGIHMSNVVQENPRVKFTNVHLNQLIGSSDKISVARVACTCMRMAAVANTQISSSNILRAHEFEVYIAIGVSVESPPKLVRVLKNT